MSNKKKYNKTMEYLILKDVETPTNSYKAGTMITKVEKDISYNDYITYQSSIHREIMMKKDMFQLARTRIDIDFMKFQNLLEMSEIEKLISIQSTKAGSIAFINRVITSDEIIYAVMVQIEHMTFCSRRKTKYNKHLDEIPIIMLKELLHNINRSREIGIRELHIGYHIPQDRLNLGQKQTISHLPGESPDRHYYTFGIFNHYLITGETLIPIREF